MKGLFTTLRTRLSDSSPLSRDAAVLVALLIFVVAHFAPALSGFAFTFKADNLYSLYPRVHWAADELVAGRLPLWTSNYSHGFPTYLDQQGLFHPFTLLILKLLPWLRAFAVIVASYFFLAASATYFFSRVIGLTRGAAFVASIAYVFAGHQVYWGQEIIWAGTIAVFPVFFLLAEALRRWGWKAVLPAALVVAHGWLSAYVELLLQAFLFAFLWVLVRDWSGKTWRMRLRTATLFLAASAVGTVIVLPWLLPAISHVAYSARAQGAVHHGGKGFLGILNALQAFFPTADVPIMNPFAGTIGAEYAAFLFVGIWPFFLAVLAISRNWADRRVRYLAIAGLSSYAVALPFLPLYDLLHALPILSFFRLAWKWITAGSFFLALLAGVGFEIVGGQEQGAMKRSWRLAGVTALFLVTVSLGLFVVFSTQERRIADAASRYFAEVMYQNKTREKPLAYYSELIPLAVARARWFLDPRNPGMLAALLPLGGIAVLGLGRTRLRSRRFGAAIISGTLAASLFLNGRHILIFRESSWWNIVPRSASYLAAQASGYRYFSVPVDVGEYTDTWNATYRFLSEDVFRELLLYDANLHYGLDSISNKTALMTARAQRVIDFLKERSSVTEERAGTLRFRRPDFASALPLFRRMSVRYVVSPVTLPAPYSEVFSYEYPPGFSVIISEVPDAFPRVFLADAASEVSGSDAAFAALISPGSGRDVFLECDGCATQTGVARTDDHAEVRYRTGLLSVRTKTASARWLVFNERGLPNWIATIDGRPARIVPANYLYQAVLVPMGEHEVVFRSAGFWERFVISIGEILPR